MMTQMGFTQNSEIGDTGDGRNFMKRIEPNLLQKATVFDGKKYYRYNLKSKTEIEKFLFGEINAKMEFYIEPSFDGAYGIRIVRDSLNTGYLIESKKITNWKETTEQLKKELPSKAFKVEQISKITEEEYEQARRYNSAIYAKWREEELKRYTIATHSTPVKDEFAEQLYNTVVSTIKNFVMIGDPASIFDGYSATFRCVAGDELWTLTIQEPEGEIKQLVDFFNQIISDMGKQGLDEAKYAALLSSIVNSQTLVER